MNFKKKLSVTIVLVGLFNIGYSDPEVTTQWSNNLPGSNQSIEQVESEMNKSVNKGKQTDPAEQVFQKEQNRINTLPSNPELSDEALDYLTFCNEQLPNMLREKYGATMLSTSKIKSTSKKNIVVLNYETEAIKSNETHTYNVQCVVENNKAKLSLVPK